MVIVTELSEEEGNEACQWAAEEGMETIPSGLKSGEEKEECPCESCEETQKESCGWAWQTGQRRAAFGPAAPEGVRHQETQNQDKLGQEEIALLCPTQEPVALY